MIAPQETASSGRTVLVTGGANGIGWAIGQRFAAGGDRVVLADLDEALALSRAAELGEGHLALRVDMADPDSVRSLIQTCLDRTGRLDVLVNNAGILEAIAAPFVDQTIEDAARVLSVNVAGILLAAELAAEHFRSRRCGVIVNLASCAGLAAVPGRSAYGSTKAAIAGLTRSMAVAWAPFGVRVNSVAPGYTLTELNQRLIASGRLNVETLNRRVPLGRMATPAEMAEVVFHLASQEASFVTGANVLVDGGLMAFGGLGAASATEAPTAAPGRRTVMVAGAAGPIGDALKRRFLAMGDHVIRLDTKLSPAAVTAAIGKLGPLDALIHSPEPWPGKPRDDQAGYLLDTLMLTKAAGRHLAAGASVVLLAPSEPTHDGQAAQSGTLLLSRGLACEWAASGVRVNAVVYDRDGPDRLLPPMGRVSTPGEIASVALFLSSGAASYVTGATIPVDGGRSAMAGWISHV